MTELASDLGIDTASNSEVFLAISAYTFAVVTTIWVIGLFRRNHSIMDAYYGFGYVIPALLAYTIADAQSQIALALLLMVGFHGCRLGWFLASRMKRYIELYGGDPRYNGFYEKLKDGYWWKSFFLVMEPQTILIVLVGSPAVLGILESRSPDGQIGALAVVGIVVFGIGLYYESLADGQLQAFMADRDANPGGPKRYLNTGVWTYSRHPNYFGTTMVWWGIWLVAMSASPDVWWTVIGPIVNTLMLTVLTGSRMTDQIMGSRPAYREIMARTRSFWPLPVPESRIAENRAKLVADAAPEAAASPEPAGNGRS